ncbi:phosphatidylserine decarboxylase family protein [Sphingobacteriales bacterium UPWRP_1]|nr:phosphatidylserine decarboxylase [Sphingobacteriales bacterium TSM_CSS]PSJ76691.1 phosphatidylserine decarboxylase family protein [Sphingobacteriales bacterium UPWRP_1]
MKKFKVHKEGYKILLVTGVVLLLLNAILHYFFNPAHLLVIIVGAVSLLLYGFMLYFFRNPKLILSFLDNRYILAPADGKIVVIEEVEEPEYFKDRRIQVSIFMSPANVHVNRSPISGVVKYTKYHPGNYLVAWHPKSSELNERFTSVIACPQSELEILVRQIAGKVARKISNYLDEGEETIQGWEFGFIKFGSRVDIFLPLNADIQVHLKQKVKGGKTILAILPDEDEQEEKQHNNSQTGAVTAAKQV